MSVMALYTTTCTKLARTNNLVLLGMVSLFLVVGVRLVPRGLIRLITLVTLVTLSLIVFLLVLGIGFTLLCIHLTLRGSGANA